MGSLPPLSGCALVPVLLLYRFCSLTFTCSKQLLVYLANGPIAYFSTCYWFYCGCMEYSYMCTRRKTRWMLAKAARVYYIDDALEPQLGWRLSTHISYQPSALNTCSWAKIITLVAATAIHSSTWVHGDDCMFQYNYARVKSIFATCVGKEGGKHPMFRIGTVLHKFKCYLHAYSISLMCTTIPNSLCMVSGHAPPILQCSP